MSRSGTREAAGPDAEGPPPRYPQRYNWPAIAEGARRLAAETPREPWFKLWDEDVYSTAESIRQSKIAALRPSKGFEVRTANTHYVERDDGSKVRMCKAWVRYYPKKDRGEG